MDRLVNLWWFHNIYGYQIKVLCTLMKNTVHFKYVISFVSYASIKLRGKKKKKTWKLYTKAFSWSPPDWKAMEMHWHSQCGSKAWNVLDFMALNVLPKLKFIFQLRCKSPFGRFWKSRKAARLQGSPEATPCLVLDLCAISEKSLVFCESQTPPL